VATTAFAASCLARRALIAGVFAIIAFCWRVCGEPKFIRPLRQEAHMGAYSERPRLGGSPTRPRYVHHLVCADSWGLRVKSEP